MPINRSIYKKQDLSINAVREEPVIKNLKELGTIEIILIGGRGDKRYAIWKRMMEEEHYLHTAKTYGQRIRYLIKSSEFGWIGGIGFSSGAWRLKCRDELLGGRGAKLNKIICNNRFLISGRYSVKNLASYVMSRCLKRVRRDWAAAYGVEPILAETFVDTERFDGASYKASNWKLIGRTKGRGRDDRDHDKKVSEKYIFVYELEPGVIKAKKVYFRDWVEAEMADTEIKNKGKRKRLMSIMRDFFAKPCSPITMSCEGAAKQKGAYRFFSDDKVSSEAILNPHINQTIERARGEKVVLAVSDTTSFNLSNKGTKGLGCLGHVGEELGYLLHDTVLFTPLGVPLGVIGSETWVRKIEEHGKKYGRKKKGIEEKESSKWLRSFIAASEVQAELPKVKVVNIGDREADIYELFELAEKTGSSFLVRSAQNRITEEGSLIWDTISAEKPSGKMKVTVYDLNKKQREAEIEIRFLKVSLRIPKNKKRVGAVSVWGIIAEEINPPEGEEAAIWKLITNIEIKNFEEACEKVEWYSIRFKIEIFHRILKSGRRSEDKRLSTVERLERCLAIDMITAWRLMYLTMLGRETPEINADFFLTEMR